MDANTQTLPGQIAAGELATKSDDLLAKAEQIKALIVSLKSTNADLEAKLSASSGVATSLRTEIQTASTEIDALIGPQPQGATPADLAGKVALLKVSYDGLNLAKRDIEAKFQASDTELGAAKAQLVEMDTLAKAKADLEGQMTAKDAEIARLTEELSKSQDDLTTITSAKGDLEAQLDDLNKQVASLRKSDNDDGSGSGLGKAAVAGVATVGAAALAKKVGDDDTEVQPEPAVSAAPAKPAVQPVAAQTPKTLGLVAAGATIGAAGADLDLTTQLQARDAEIADLKARLEATTTVLQSRDAEFGIAQEQLTAATASEASLADLTAKHTELQTQFDELAAANTKLATLQLQLDELTTAKAGLDASLQDKDKSLADMQVQLTGLQTSLDGLTAEKAEVETGLNSRNAEFDALTAKMGVLNGNLDAAVAAKAQLDDALKAREAELSDLRADVARVKEESDKTGASRLAEIGVLTAGAAAAATSIKQKDNELADAQAKISALEAQLNTLQDQLNAAQTMAGALEAANAKVNDAEGQLTSLRAEIDGAAQAAASELEAANAKRVDAEGQLASLRAEVDGATQARAELESRINELTDQLAQVRDESDKSADSRVAEIGVLTAGAAAAAATIKQRNDELAEARDKIGTLEAQLVELQSRLDEAQTRVNAFETDARSAPEPAAVTLAAEEPQATLMAEAPAEEAAPTVADRAMLKTVAADAALAIGAEVKSSECPQHLSQSKGIGSVFEQRLYAAGIGTYWELANLPDDQFKHILDLNDRQLIRMDFNEIRSDALRLANETDSVGRIWDGGTPDDFEPLEGIGKLYEKRLYDAGICTFATLASAAVEQLAAICPGTKLRTPDYADWIAQAKRLAGL